MRGSVPSPRPLADTARPGTAQVFRFAADLAWRRQGAEVQVLEGNLRRVIGAEASGGELRALSRPAMRSYARYWLEAFRLPVVPVDRLVGVPVDQRGPVIDRYGDAAGRVAGPGLREAA
jgi:KDO2-lipid IV(A) lauroyltransferase